MIKLCSDPTPPLMECSTTTIYGAPRKKAGRIPPPPAPSVETPISGIAIHCLKDTYAGYLSKACKASPNLMPCGHASMHYVIDGDTGQVSTLVKESDVAWAFRSYLTNFPTPNPEEPYPGWPVLAAMFPTLSADFYTINIGVTIPLRTDEQLDGEDCCLGPYGLTEKAYRTLIRLVAWIADRLNIPRDVQHIAFHDDIVLTTEQCKECTCEVACFICDVTGYCENCANPGDPTFILSDAIFYVYGETENGCKVKIPVSLLGDA